MIKLLVWIVLAVVFLISPFFGAVTLDYAQVFNGTSLHSDIFYNLRLPRVLFAFFAGLILALSGLLFQTLFRNPLMTPYTLGISSGAVLGAGIAIKLGLISVVLGVSLVSIFGFIGAMFTVFLLLYLSQFLKSSHHESLLLLGIALSLFYTSALMIVFYLGDTIQNDMLLRFTMGSLSIIGWQSPLVLGFISVILFLAIYIYRYELELLNISDETSKLKGLDTKKITLILLVISSFSIGFLVSISGPIGFIGLIVPHIVIRLYPITLKRRIAYTAFFGGLFLVMCDTLARVIQTQSELPIGIITAIVGGPFFIYLIISRSKRV
jgi:iron complex transport system permease protein